MSPEKSSKPRSADLSEAVELIMLIVFVVDEGSTSGLHKVVDIGFVLDASCSRETPGPD